MLCLCRLTRIHRARLPPQLIRAGKRHYSLPSRGMANKLLIDVDTGTDDAMAIMMALAAPSVEVVGITCVSGNVDVEQVCHNTMRVLHTCQRIDVPVYKGCAQPLLGNVLRSGLYHGKDGLGDATFHDSPDLSLGNTEHAAAAMVKWANAFPGEVTLVCLAPLTNVAVAVQLDPDLGKKLKQCVIMGGNIYGRGNISLTAEFNFSSDPEAAHFVLKDFQCPVTILPWEPCFQDVTLPWEWFEGQLNRGTTRAAFVKAITAGIVERQRKRDPEYYTCDPAAMAIAIDGTIVTESLHKYCTVELHGHVTRGQMVVDWSGITKQRPNVELVMKVNIDKLQKLYEQMLS